MTKQEMMTTVYNQLAIDYNCKPEDFAKDGVIFTAAKKSGYIPAWSHCFKTRLPNLTVKYYRFKEIFD